MSADEHTVVDFHFDLMCPFAYQTSLWMRQVRDQLGITVNWRFFSLEEINRAGGKKHPWEREWSYGWSMMRIGTLLRRRDNALLDAWYARAGRALHLEGDKPHDAGGFGVPTLFFGDGQCLFGPVLIDPPTGEAALRLWRTVTGMLEFPQVYELQRPKSRGDNQAIERALRPYLAGRDWQSVNRGEVIEFSPTAATDSTTDGETQ